MALIDLPIDPPEEPDFEKAHKLAVSLAHSRLSLPPDIEEDCEADVFLTGPKTAIVHLTLAVSVELD